MDAPLRSFRYYLLNRNFAWKSPINRLMAQRYFVQIDVPKSFLQQNQFNCSLTFRECYELRYNNTTFQKQSVPKNLSSQQDALFVRTHPFVLRKSSSLDQRRVCKNSLCRSGRLLLRHRSQVWIERRSTSQIESKS